MSSETLENKTTVPGIKAAVTVKEDLLIIKEEFLALKKELGELTYQLSSLYDRWSIEHQHVGKREAEMTRTINAFSEQITALKTIEGALQKNIQTTTSKAAVMVADLVGKELIKKFTQEIEGLKNTLSDEIVYARDVLRDYKNRDAHEQLKIWGAKIVVAVLVGVIVGGLVSWWYKPSYAVMQATFCSKGG